MKPKLIILESSPASGKSTIAKLIRENLPNTTLFDLGSIENDTKTNSYFYHSSILSTVYDLRGTGSNFVFARSFITNQVYYLMGKKDYDNTDNFGYFCDRLKILTLYYDITIINLCCSRNEYEKRLEHRGKKCEYIKYNSDESMKQQRVYMELMDKIRDKELGVNVVNLNNTGLKKEQTLELIMKMI